MIVGSRSFFIPTLAFCPASSAILAPNPLSNPALFSLSCALLHHQSEAHHLPFQSLPHSFAKTRKVSSTAFLHLFSDFSSSLRKSSRINTYRRSPRFIGFWPKSSARTPIGISTYGLFPVTPLSATLTETGGGVALSCQPGTVHSHSCL